MGGHYNQLSTTKVNDVRFRLIGINQDNRADGTGKAGLTFQAIGYFRDNKGYMSDGDFRSQMDQSNLNANQSNAGSWRDSQLRKDLNDESTGIIWNDIQSTDFKDSIAPVLKTTNNNANSKGNSSNTSNASSTTVDKLWILSPSEIGMPVIKNYNVIQENSTGNGQRNANVHYYDSDTYKNTIKSSSDGDRTGSWDTEFDYIYHGNIYQWWMLPAGSRKMSNGNQAYHNTDSYSYCAPINVDIPRPSDNKICKEYYYSYLSDGYWLRSSFMNKDTSYYMINLLNDWSSSNHHIVIAFSF